MESLKSITSIDPVLAAGIAGLATWGATALGAALVFFFRELDKKITNIMLGLASGVMIAASFWSLLDPAIQQGVEDGMGRMAFLPALIGFLLGGAFLLLIDRIIPHLHLGEESNNEAVSVEGGHIEGGSKKNRSNIQRSFLLVLAITIHNIPEGLAVGVAFGAVQSGNTAAFMSAVVLALGMAIQNFPEGAAVSIPLRGEGMSRGKSFWYGQLSAIVEPIFAVLGALLVSRMKPILPYALSFAAGAMIFVVVEELIPESQIGDGADYSAIGVMIGFAIMMALDVALG